MMDMSKHASVFNPAKFQGSVAIVGVGALGSAVALQLAKLSVPLVLFDVDSVERHNLSNQILYGEYDIGRFKVDAAKDALHRLTEKESNITVYPFNLKHRSQLSPQTTAVIMCVDTMAERKKLFNNIGMMNPHLRYYADGRMGTKHLQALGFNPGDPVKEMAYTQHRLYPDEDVSDDVGGCGVVQSIGATASMLASIMVWQFIQYFTEEARMREGLQAGKLFRRDDLPFEEIMMDCATMTITHKGLLTS